MRVGKFAYIFLLIIPCFLWGNDDFHQFCSLEAAGDFEGVIVGCENYAQLPSNPEEIGSLDTVGIEDYFESWQSFVKKRHSIFSCHAVYFKEKSGYGLPIPLHKYYGSSNPNSITLKAHAIDKVFKKVSFAPKWLLEIAEPYLLPDSHPIKGKLDKLFGSKRVTFSLKTLQDAGFLFSLVNDSNRYHVIVARHPKIPGYLIKLFTDIDHPRPMIHGFDELLHRAIGAQLIRNEIKQIGSTNFMVPNKWLYILPTHPDSSKEKVDRKYFVLIVEDVFRLNHTDNQEYWATQITHEILNELHHLIGTLKLWDIHCNNLVFTESGRLAFVDTKYWGPYDAYNGDESMMWSRPRFSLSDEMKAYWDKLLESSSNQ